MPQAGTLSPRRYYQKAPADSVATGAPAATPAQIQTAMDRAGMDSRTYLGPGRPLRPAGGYSGRPRSTDYPAAVNVATQGRAAWGRPSYATLRAIIDAYDVARMCVNHKIDELRSMEPMFLPAKGVKEDVDDEIEVAELALAYPDRELPYDSWVSKWLEGAVKFDSAPLYRRRNYGGEIIGLEVVDGTTLHPYIDGNGRRPRAENPGEVAPPAFYQTIHGLIWQEFTAEDMVYVPFRPQDNSPYGLAPIESILLTANTDIRFQWHFLQMFTDGSIPAGFMELPPDISSPAQVEEWQECWDAMILGDQAKLGQLIAVPNGSKFTATKPAAFDKTFPQYLMMRTCAAYGVVPQDIGLIEDVNRSNGETQVDVQFRVNTLPWVRYVEGHLTRYLQHDLGLRVQVKLDTGRDKEDRLAEAQAHQLYVEMGAESPDEVRSEVLGLPIDKERPTPRFVMVERVGPIPLLSIEGIAGKTDPDTHGPAKDQPALDQPYVPPVGVIPTPGTSDDQAALAATDQMQISQRRQLEQEQGSTPARESREQKHQRGAKARQDHVDAQDESAEEDEATRPAQPSDTQQEPEDAKPGSPVAKQALEGREAEELLAFREFVRGSVRKGRWDRDFAFFTVPGLFASELNRGGRAEVAAGRVEKSAKGVPGLTKRSGMISLDLDPGTVPEVPGGPSDHHITIVYLGKDVSDEEFERACQRAQAAASAEDGPVEGSVGGFGVFPPSDGSDGKIPFFAPADVPATTRLYARLKDLSASGRQAYHPHVTRAYLEPGDVMPEPAPQRPVRFTHLSVHRGGQVNRYPLGGPNAVTPAEVAKANFTDPKAPGRSSSADDWPGWRYDLAASQYWAPRIAAALLGALDVHELVTAWLATRQHQQDGRDEQQREHQALTLAAIALAWLASYRAALVRALTPVLDALYTDGYTIGAASAQAYLAGRAAEQVIEADLAHWSPGDTDAARLLLGQWGDGAGLRTLLAEAEITIKSVADTRLEEMARILGQGVADGLGVDEIAEQIRDLLSNPGRARMIAVTEISRANAKAAEDRYRRAGYAATRWLTDGAPCAVCVDNQDQGAVAIGRPFPSGDLRPPAHPHCRCVTAPAYVEE